MKDESKVQQVEDVLDGLTPLRRYHRVWAEIQEEELKSKNEFELKYKACADRLNEDREVCQHKNVVNGMFNAVCDDCGLVLD